nr:MAG TPA: hypothetical protein [Caudoviricetes sp.]
MFNLLIHMTTFLTVYFRVANNIVYNIRLIS